MRAEQVRMNMGCMHEPVSWLPLAAAHGLSWQFALWAGGSCRNAGLPGLTIAAG